MSLANSPERIPAVVVATGIMNAGGTESLIMETLRQASGRIRYIMLIHCDRDIVAGVFDDEIRSLGVATYYIPSVGSVGIRAYVKAFRDFVKTVDSPIDIIHSHLNGAGGVISLAAKKVGIKHRICHCHADIHFTGTRRAIIKNEMKLWCMKALIELNASDCWACSKAAWSRLFMPWRKRTVVNNMIDTRRYFASDEKRRSVKTKYGFTGKRIVGAVGRVAPIKNYETILKAIKDTDVHFVCFGRFSTSDAYCASLITLADELGVSNRVHWMGNSTNVAEDIHCIDVFVMPSFTEGFGMAAIEAQAASIPVLLSTGIPAVVDLGLGLTTFLQPDSPQSWRQAILDGGGVGKVSDTLTLKRFQEKGFDAPTAVMEIENNYISMIENEK